jgi:hypothetical protein
MTLLALTAALFWQYLFTSPTPLIFPESSLGTDLPLEVWPLARFVVDGFRQTGYLPLWRPYLMSGAPLIGHPIAPVLYPPNWLVLVLPLAIALNVIAVGHLWWAGVGMYLYLRLQRGARLEAAFIGALVFALCPKWIAHLSGGHWPMLAAIAWWPWAWLAVTRFWATGQFRWTVLLGVTLAAQAMNHLMFFALSLASLGLVTFGYIRRQIGTWLRKAVVCWGIALLVAAGLAAGQLWPLLDLIPYANRKTLTPVEAGFGSLPPALMLSTLFAPDLKFPEWFVFPGAGALALAATGWALGWSRREWGWASAALVGIVISLGNNTPLFAGLYEIVPVFRFFRIPARWSILTFFAVAILVAWGVDRWFDQAARPRRRLRLTVLAVGFFYLVAGAFKLAAPQSLPFDVLPSSAAVLLILTLVCLEPLFWRFAAVVIILFGELAWTASGLIRLEAEANLAAADALTAVLQPAAALGERSFAPYGGLETSTVVSYGLLAADGYDSFQMAAYAELARRASGCKFSGYAVAVPPTQASPEAVRACPTFVPEERLLGLLNIRFVILNSAAELPGAELRLIDHGRWVYDYGPGLGRAFGVARGHAAPVEDCVGRLATLDPATEAVTDKELPFEAGGVAPLVFSWEAGVNSQVFSVSAGTAGLLIRSETWAPGWQARVDGVAAEVLRVDCALQGVWLGPGEHQVRFEYAPRGYKWGRWVSLLTALFLLIGSIGLVYRTTRRSLASIGLRG